MTQRSLFFRVFPSVALPMFLAVSDQTLVATALPAIVGDFGHVALISWVVVGYLVANTLMAPVYGRLGDLLGRRRMLLIALLIFMLGALTCAVAPSFEVLIAARALQGFGGGGLMTLSHALIGDGVPLRERGRYQGYLATVALAATTFGPLAGGLIAAQFGWRAVFLSSIPFAMLAFALAFRLPDRQDAPTGKRRFDALGLALFAGTIVPLLLAIQMLPLPGRSGSVASYALLATAAICLLALLKVEKRVETPLFPLDLLSRPTIWRCAVVAGSHGAAFVSLVTFTPIFLRAVRGLSPAEIGTLLFTLTAGVGIGSLLCGRLVSRTGRTMIFPSVGLSVAVLSLLVLGMTFPLLDTLALQVLYGVIAICFGTVMGVLQVTVQHVAGKEGRGAASGAVQFSRSLGASIGTVTVSSALFYALGSQDPTAVAAFNALLDQGPAMLSSLSETVREDMTRALLSGFRNAFLVVAATAAVGMLASWRTPLRRVWNDREKVA